MTHQSHKAALQPSVAQAGLGPGAYSGGRITVQPLPAGLHRAGGRTWPLRRLECKVTEEEVAKHSEKELQKVGLAHLTHHQPVKREHRLRSRRPLLIWSTWKQQQSILKPRSSWLLGHHGVFEG